MSDIPLLERGKAPTLLQAEIANQLIRSLNSFRRMQCKPDGIARLAFTETNTVLDFAALAQRLDKLEKAIADPDIADLTQAEIAALKSLAANASSILAVQSQLAGGVLSIVCNEDGTISGSVSFPGGG